VYLACNILHFSNPRHFFVGTSGSQASLLTSCDHGKQATYITVETGISYVVCLWRSSYYDSVVAHYILILAALAPLALSAARCEECRFVYRCSHLCKCNIKVRCSQNTTVHRACHTDRNSVTKKRKHMLCNHTYTLTMQTQLKLKNGLRPCIQRSEQPSSMSTSLADRHSQLTSPTGLDMDSYIGLHGLHKVTTGTRDIMSV